VSTDTTLRFKATDASRYLVRWRRTDANQWHDTLAVTPVSNPGCFAGSGGACEVVLKGIRVDDWVFGASSVSNDGFESPVAAAVPGGAFKPYVVPPPAQ
jgi:hypothetical protein